MYKDIYIYIYILCNLQDYVWAFNTRFGHTKVLLLPPSKESITRTSVMQCEVSMKAVFL